MIFSFSPRWKEELVVSSAQGSFVLAFWMGRPTVELPTEAALRQRGPDWVQDHWSALHAQLTMWCRGNGARLEISADAPIWSA